MKFYRDYNFSESRLIYTPSSDNRVVMTKSGRPAAEVLIQSSPPPLTSPDSSPRSAIESPRRSEFPEQEVDASECENASADGPETDAPFTHASPDSPCANPAPGRDSVFRPIRPMIVSNTNPMIRYIQSLEASVASLIAESVKQRRLLESQARRQTETQQQLRDVKAMMETVVVTLGQANHQQQQPQPPLQSQPVHHNNEATPTTTTTSNDPHEIMTEDFPTNYKIDKRELWKMKEDSTNAGNFASKLTQRFFPELFGVANLRFQFNWYGGGKLLKSELCSQRKNVIRKYVNFYFPEVTPESVWRDVVVPRVNELLRRPSSHQRKEKRQISQPQENTLPNVSFGSMMTYLDM